MSEKILVILADGFEEIEAVTIIDILRRLELKLIVAGLDKKNIKGAHNITIEADCLLEEVDYNYYNAVVLPGGLPGSTTLRDSEQVMDIVRHIYKEGGIAAAICAAPIALYKAGVLAGKKVTSHPAFEEVFENSIYSGEGVEVDGRIITAKGAGLTAQFTGEIAKALGVDPEETLNSMFMK